MPILAIDNRMAVRKMIWDALQWQPKALQLPIMMADNRFIAIAGGEGSGKSECCAMRAMEYLDISKLIWLCGDEFLDSRKEFEYMAEWGKMLGIVSPRDISFPSEGQCHFKAITGCHVYTVATKDITKIGRESPDLIIMCEAARQSLAAYQRLRGRITREQGDLLLSGTYEGCLVGDTLVATSQGIKQLKNISCIETVQGLSGNGFVSSTFNNGVKNTVRLKLDKGFEIEGTLDHKVVTRIPDGSVVWKELDQIEKKDLIAIRYGCNLWGNRRIDHDLSYLAGLYIAEGCCSKDGRFTITTSCKQIQKYLLDSDFMQQDDGKGYHFRKTDHELVNGFKDLGLGLTEKARTKEVPFAILEADRESVIAFLRGLFDGDGSAYPKGIFYYTSSIKLAEQVKFLLLNLGIMSSLSNRVCKSFGKISAENYTVGISDPVEFMKIVGFRFNEKRNIEGNKLGKPRYLRNQANAGSKFLEYPVCWVRLKSKSYSQAETFDITVDNGHAYWANGLIVHNSLGWWPELVEKWSGYNVEDGKSFVMPTWANTAKYRLGTYQIVLTDGTVVKNVGKELHDLWYNSNTPPDICMERYAGRRVKPAGMVIPEFNIEYHVGDYPYNEKFPVDIAVDPGYGVPGAHAVLAIQMMEGGQIQVVDEIYLQHITTEEIIEKMQREKQWGKSFSDGAIDIAGKGHAAMPAPIEVWKKLTGVLLKCKKVTDVEGGIELVRGLMLPDRRTGFCKIVFNYSCYGIISELGGGPSPVIGGGPWQRNLQTNKPLESNCHSTKALLYYCVSRLGYTIKKRESQYGKLLVPRGRLGRLVPLSEFDRKRLTDVRQK